MEVKGNHPLAEIIAKKLFSIESVPKEEQKKMVRRAIKEAVKYHIEKLDELRTHNLDLICELEDLKEKFNI